MPTHKGPPSLACAPQLPPQHPLSAGHRRCRPPPAAAAAPRPPRRCRPLHSCGGGEEGAGVAVDCLLDGSWRRRRCARPAGPPAANGLLGAQIPRPPAPAVLSSSCALTAAGLAACPTCIHLHAGLVLPLALAGGAALAARGPRAARGLLPLPLILLACSCRGAHCRSLKVRQAGACCAQAGGAWPRRGAVGQARQRRLPQRMPAPHPPLPACSPSPSSSGSPCTSSTCTHRVTAKGGRAASSARVSRQAGGTDPSWAGRRPQASQRALGARWAGGQALQSRRSDGAAQALCCSCLQAHKRGAAAVRVLPLLLNVVDGNAAGAGACGQGQGCRRSRACYQHTGRRVASAAEQQQAAAWGAAERGRAAARGTQQERAGKRRQVGWAGAPERTSLIWKPAPEGMPSASSRDSGSEAPLMTMGPLQGMGWSRMAACGWVACGCAGLAQRAGTTRPQARQQQAGAGAAGPQPRPPSRVHARRTASSPAVPVQRSAGQQEDVRSASPVALLLRFLGPQRLELLPVLLLQAQPGRTAHRHRSAEHGK